MGTGHGAQRRRVEAERPERVLGADALLAQHALDALPDDGVGQQVGRAHDEDAAARLVQRPRADAREVGEQRPEARAPLEVAEEARIRGVRVVDDRRRRPRLVRHEEVHPEAVEARRELRVVPLLARALLLARSRPRCRRGRPSPRRAPAARARASCARPSPRRASSRRHGLHRRVDDDCRRPSRTTSSRAASKPALCARTSCAAFSTSFVSFSSLSVERALRRLVEDVELLGAHRLAVEDRERLHAALHRAGRRSRASWRATRAGG